MGMFASELLDWFDEHGRHDLPWQKDRSLYRVWVSEIMLQQTQVTTVIPYFRKFMGRFPSLKQLAAASQDDVLVYWAGLGYYSRARNLHKAAQKIVDVHGGRFPRDIDSAVDLPGIGPSTAAAILSQALDERHAILDGNVKRVLSRFHAIEGWPGERAIERQLWALAEEHTPDTRNRDYTQAIMDLGATLCTRSKPGCQACPVREDCHAFATGSVDQYPTPKPKREKPVRAARFLMLTDPSGAVMLEKRPSTGIWGGLWSLPELGMDEDVSAYCEQRWGLRLSDFEDIEAFRHTFSHYHLDIHARICDVSDDRGVVSDPGDICWVEPEAEILPAVAAPVAKLLADYQQVTE